MVVDITFQQLLSSCGRPKNPTNIVDLLDFLTCPLVAMKLVINSSLPTWVVICGFLPKPMVTLKGITPHFQPTHHKT